MPMPALSIQSTDFIKISKPANSPIEQINMSGSFPYYSDFTNKSRSVFSNGINKYYLTATLPVITIASRSSGVTTQTAEFTIKVTADTNYVAKISYSDLSDTDIASVSTAVKMYYAGGGYNFPDAPPSGSFDLLNSPSGIMTNIDEQSMTVQVPVTSMAQYVRGVLYLEYTIRPAREIEEQDWRCTVL